MASSFYAGCLNQDVPHFLDACSRCGKPLGFNSDIFMYRGNTPFCSKECRQEQIEIDESKEKSQKLSSSSARSLRKSESKTSSTTTPAGKNVRTSTVVVG